MKIDQSLLQMVENWKRHEITRLLAKEFAYFKEVAEGQILSGELINDQIQTSELIGELAVINIFLNPVPYLEGIEAEKDIYDDEK